MIRRATQPPSRAARDRRRRGTITTWMALSLPVLVGFLGLGADAGLMIARQALLLNEVDTWAAGALQSAWLEAAAPPPEDFAAEEGWWDAEAGAFVEDFPCSWREPCRALPARQLGREETHDLLFAPLVGMPEATIAASAVAATEPRRIVIAVDVSSAMEGVLDEVGDELAEFFDRKEGLWLMGDALFFVTFADGVRRVEAHPYENGIPGTQDVRFLRSWALEMETCGRGTYGFGGPPGSHSLAEECGSDHHQALQFSALTLSHSVAYPFARRTEGSAPVECSRYPGASDASTTRDLIVFVHAAEPSTEVAPYADVVAAQLEEGCDIQIVPILVNPTPPAWQQTYNHALARGDWDAFQIDPDELADTLMAIADDRRAHLVQ